jgi:hypothetical protein
MGLVLLLASDRPLLVTAVLTVILWAFLGKLGSAVLIWLT